MIRAPWGKSEFWKKWCDFDIRTISEIELQLKLPSANPSFRPQYVWHLVLDYARLMLRRYSSGCSNLEIIQHFAGLLDAWELSNKLAADLSFELKSGEGWDHNHLGTAPQKSGNAGTHADPRTWEFDLRSLNHYNLCFWLVGLALTLGVPDDQWHRLVALINAEGQDEFCLTV